MSGGGPAKVRPIRPGGALTRERDVELWIVGLNHKSTPVELRELLAFEGHEIGEAARRVLQVPEVSEATVLSTCNRIEVMVVAARGAEVAGELARFLARERNLTEAAIADHRYVHRGKQAVRHLFRVASSLDSMIVGEPQILGQVKEQFGLAAQSGAAGSVLRRCFEKSFAVAKRVRSETGVAGKAVSVSSAAVELTRRIFDDLGDKTAMLLGAGKMGQLAARHLLQQGIASVIVSNRSFDRAVELARLFEGTPVPFERFPQYLHIADVVLGSVAGTGYIVGPSHLHEVLRARRQKPMFFIDLGVPRNFDPGINDLDNVYLYNIDDLVSVADDHRAEREREAMRGEAIVVEEADRFWQWFSGRDLTPTIVALRGKLDGIRRAELERAVATLARLEPADRQCLEAMTLAMVNKILHGPLSALKELAMQADGESAADAAHLLSRLFSLESDDEGEPGTEA